jgi:hypothetical protein
MKAKIITGGMLLLTVIALSCKKEKTWVYEGAPVIEFSNPPSNAYTKTIYTANVPVLDSAIIQLIGPHVATETKIGWDTVNTTATIPAQIELVTAYGTASIPAKSSQGKVAFNLTPAAAGKKLGLILKDGDVKASVNAKTMTFTVTAAPIDWSVLAATTKPVAGGKNDTIVVRITAAAARFGKELSFDYTVKPTSTAVEGVDYTFITPKGKTVFAAGAGTGIVVVKFNPVAAAKKLELLLSTVPGISVAAARNTYVHTVNP